jgi:hypothetical protein
MSGVEGPRSAAGKRQAGRPAPLLLRAAAGIAAGLLPLAIALVLILPRLAGGEESAAVRANAPAPTSPYYELSARVSLPHGFIKEASWLDADNYLALLLSPDGAAVWKVGFTQPERLKFMSSNFMEERICPAQYAPRLSWVVSPAKRYICFMWFLDDGSRQWALVDISSAPEFKLKRFTVPAGMQVAQALFSPDDHYLVLAHDGLREGSAASVVVLDLQQGVEAWRIGTHELNFVSSLWWGGAVYDAPKFCAAAGLSDGKFYEDPGLALCDVKTQQLSFTPSPQSLLLGAEALWGKTLCYASPAQAAIPFSLEAVIPGVRPQGSIPLSARPVQLSMLPAPGLVLISNTVDYVTNQLWLVNVLAGDKNAVDSDCASFSVSSDSKLLVRGQTQSELRIYTLAQPGVDQAAPKAPPAQPRNPAAPKDETTPPGGGKLPITF